MNENNYYGTMLLTIFVSLMSIKFLSFCEFRLLLYFEQTR